MRALVLVALLLASCATNSRLEDAGPAPAPYGYIDYCKRNPDDPVCGVKK